MLLGLGPALLLTSLLITGVGAGPPPAQESRTSEWLAAVLLTEADLPGHLRLNNRLSAPMTHDLGLYVPRVFDADPTQVGGDGVVGVSSTIILVSGAATALDVADPVLLDVMSDAAKRAVVYGIAAPTDLPRLAVGEDNRSFTNLLRDASGTGAVATMVFRRRGAFVTVTVVNRGQQPAVNELLRLAQIVDARLVAAGTPP